MLVQDNDVLNVSHPAPRITNSEPRRILQARQRAQKIAEERAMRNSKILGSCSPPSNGSGGSAHEIMVESNGTSGSVTVDQSKRSHREKASPRKVRGIANKVDAPRSESTSVKIAGLNRNILTLARSVRAETCDCCTFLSSHPPSLK
jgi:hypothetical protein